MLLIIGFLFAVLFTALMGAMQAMVVFFINVPSLMLIIIPLAFFLWASKSGAVIAGYIRSSFKKDYEYSKAELESIAAVARHIIKLVLAMGGFGFMFGLVALLTRLDTPEQFGVSLAVSLITILYSIAIGFFVFFPVQVWAENKIRKM